MDWVLDASRQEIIAHQGHVLVTGGPGSGKTTVALLRAARFCEQDLQDQQKVLFLSFSRAAVARLVESSNKVLTPKIRSRIEISTLHAFLGDFTVNYGYLLGAPRRIKYLLPHDEQLMQAFFNDEAAWPSETERLFLEEGLLVFDLFAAAAARLLKGSRNLATLVSGRFPLIMLDEAQDTAEDQWACICELAAESSITCLADLDQQIFAWREGVNEARVEEITQFLNPLVRDLAGDNRRSAGTEIVQFGNDVLFGKLEARQYAGVARAAFSPKAEKRDLAIRKAVGIINKELLKLGIERGSVAYLARTNVGVNTIAAALQGDARGDLIPHRVLIDEVQVFLAARVVASLLEPSDSLEELLLRCLEGIKDCSIARGATSMTRDLSRWIESVRRGKVPAAALPRALHGLILKLSRVGLSGFVKQDWNWLREALNETGQEELLKLSRSVAYVFVLKRGQELVRRLSDSWIVGRGYSGASSTIESVQRQEMLMQNEGAESGISVMTIHKSKGREFDAVVILHLGRMSELTKAGPGGVSVGERRVVRVAVTRAKSLVLFLLDSGTYCQALTGWL